jgi:hypothetical protein
MEDNCEIVAKLPELNSGANQRPKEFCHREEPWLTQIKGYGIYTLPKVEVQVSGTFRSTPGTSVAAAFNATKAYLAANSTLGRPLSGNAANMTVNIAKPNELYTERRHELDIRFGKVIRYRGTRTVASLDLFNALNSNAIVNLSQNYATFLRPTEILNARLMKFSVAFDF